MYGKSGFKQDKKLSHLKFVGRVGHNDKKRDNLILNNRTVFKG